MPAPFEVLPAVDVMSGRLARLRKGDPSTLQVFSGDPMAVAERFVEQGARWLHFVDLDAAFAGGAANLEILRQLAELPVKVQAGGGLGPDDVDRALEAGADRAIVGSASLHDRPRVEALIARHGERLAVGLDVRGDRIVPRGSGTPGPRLRDAVRWLVGAGCARFVLTNVDRDGSMAGPDEAGLRRLAGWSEAIPLISSGGISGVADLLRLAAIGPPVEGAIVGRAFYASELDLGEALRAVAAG